MGYVAIKDIKAGMTFDGLEVYVKSFETKPMQKKKQDYGTGYFEDVTGSIAFKAWESNIVDVMKAGAVQGKVISIEGECSFSTYSNALEIKITGIKGEVTGCNMDNYIKSCDVEGNRATFNKIVNTSLSEPYMKALMVVLSQPLTDGTSNNLFSEFKVEQAAHSMHDALKGGLLNHTIKMCKIANVLIESDNRLAAHRDILMMGIILHDIGKIYEFDKGEKTNIGFVTHHVLGVEIMSKVKNEVVELIGEEAYYRVLSVIQGHHGEFGDRPTSIYAYITHLIDMLDAKVTTIVEKEEKNDCVMYGGNKSIKLDGYNLVI